MRRNEYGSSAPNEALLVLDVGDAAGELAEEFGADNVSPLVEAVDAGEYGGGASPISLNGLFILGRFAGLLVVGAVGL